MKETELPLSPDQAELLSQFTQILPLLHDPNLTPTQLQEVQLEHSRIYHRAYDLGMIGRIVETHAQTLTKEGKKE